MKSNLGRLDRILRFALAVWWLGPWRPEFFQAFVDVPLVYLLVTLVGLIALVESFLGYCWLHQLLHINNKD